MNNQTIQWITEKNEDDFREKCQNYRSKFIEVRRWLESKKTVLPCYQAYAFDENGGLYYKDFLEHRGTWNLMVKDDNKRKIKRIPPEDYLGKEVNFFEKKEKDEYELGEGIYHIQCKRPYYVYYDGDKLVDRWINSYDRSYWGSESF